MDHSIARDTTLIRAVNDSTTAIATCEPAKQFDGRTNHTHVLNVGHYLVEGGHERIANEEGDHTTDEELSSGNVQKVAKNKANGLDELLRAFLRGTALFFAPNSRQITAPTGDTNETYAPRQTQCSQCTPGLTP